VLEKKKKKAGDRRNREYGNSFAHEARKEQRGEMEEITKEGKGRET